MSTDPVNETLEAPSDAADPTRIQRRQQEWETAVREWLSSLPEAVTVSNVEAWVELNRTSLPDHITSMSPQDLYHKFTSLQTSTPAPQLSTPPHPKALFSTQQKDASQDNLYPYRFQRTDLWMPVYSWLESLNADELVNSQDIINWLTDNPEIREQLSVKHSRYHLMHYIKKCHIKMLKRKEKKKGVQSTGSVNPVKIQKTEATKRRVPVPYYSAGNASNNLPGDYFASNALKKLPKDSDLYAAKRNEALKKYEILLELEKQLSVLFPKPQTID